MVDAATMTDNYDQARENKRLRSQLEAKQCEIREMQKHARSGRLRSLS